MTLLEDASLPETLAARRDELSDLDHPPHEEEYESADADDDFSSEPSVFDADHLSSDSQQPLTESDARYNGVGHGDKESLTSRDRYRLQNERIIDKAREYQQELFERAKEENIIAVLDTGMGKTLIAVMLIRHTLDEDSLRSGDKQVRKSVFFLANSVPLVNQQTRVLANNLIDSVQALHGFGKHDLWERKEWQGILAQNSVIVCTPAVLHNALFHRYVRMEEISLIVFDEAHHCKKNHPYSTIVREFYMKAREPKPRLFGMTASPVESKKDIKKTIDDLEEMLHSKVVTTSDASLLEFAHKPVDESWIYSPPALPIYTELYRTLSPAKLLLPHLGPVFESAWNTSKVLGTWFANRILTYALGSTKHESGTIVSQFELNQVYTNLSSIEDKMVAIDRLSELARIAQQQHVTPLESALPEMSSKVQILYSKLAKQYARHPETKAMVFVNQRYTAVLLCDGVRALNLPNVRPAYLTGGGQSGNDTITGKKQEEVMRHFHAGLFNIVFTTSVGEEGIDVPQCNLIVRFDLYTTTIQYIQSRGRARMKGSIYAHMIEDGNFQHGAMMNYAIESADYLKLYCQSLPSDRLLGKGTKLAQLIAKESANRSFQTSSGAICNFSNCLVILSRFASSLQHVGAMRTEVYEERILEESSTMFQYVVRLPTNDQSSIKGAKGDPRHNKALAKRSAAFKCVGRLRAAGLLDENLNSIFHAVKPANLNARLAVSARQDSYDMIIKPAFWDYQLGEMPNSLCAVTLEVKPLKPLMHKLAPMMLLTREVLPQLPNFPIYLEEGIEALVSLTPLPGTLDLDLITLKSLTNFTLKSIFEDVFNKVYEHDPARLSYWLVPMKDVSVSGERDFFDLIDYNALDAASGERVRWTRGAPASLWCDRFLVDPLSGKHHYFSHDVVEDAKAFGAMPEEFQPKEIKGHSELPIIYYTDSHRKVEQKHNFAKGWDHTQPVLRAEVQTVRRNFLDQPTEQERAVRMCWIAPEPLEIARISTQGARTALAWPAIIHRLEAYLIALEAFDQIGVTGVPPDLALEALTKDNNTDDQIKQVHLGRCRGMGKNYERLEFIGDSLLKMTTTMSVFNRTTCDEEGMHCRRMELLCNRRLFTVATESLGLTRYIRASGFNRDTWYPEHLVLVDGRGAAKVPEAVRHKPRNHSLGMKTIADVCEASIGAAVMASKHLPVPDRFQSGIQAITRLVESEDHNVTCWHDFRSMYVAAEWQLHTDDPIANNLALEISKRIGYTFKYPRLIRSAFTHSSDMTAPVPDLQRLEFLGDAVLDWVCIWWLFDSNPDKNPQWLTEHKMAMVSNKFLAALAVTLDFDKLFAVKTSKLAAAIFDYAAKVRAELQAPDYEKDFWTQLSTEKPPKALSDLVESMLGAMLIDSDFDYTCIENFFNTHIKPFFINISLYDGFASMQPTTSLIKNLTGMYGCQEVKFDPKPRELDSLLGVEILTSLLVHGKPMGHAKGASLRDAKVKVSEMANELLEELSVAEFRKRYACDCERGAELEQAEAAAALRGSDVIIDGT